jgi:acyl-CoA synthetase (AMP-forming)/AMP-acid ligase II
MEICGMQKEMIVAGGYNIYPKEINEVLFNHPKILEACAVGVPDEYQGETVKAFIVVRPGGKVYPSIGDLSEGIRDPQFGPCVMFGLGGIFTEILRDVTFRPAPISDADAGKMLDVNPLIIRGSRPVAVEALVVLKGK